MALVALTVGLLATLGGASLYPDDHWSKVHKMTTDGFQDKIKREVDAGKTVMVRIIASEGWGWWRKQAPAWNRATTAFAENPDVVFADCNLQDCSPPQSHNAGAGGWPTINYCNKDTGYECAPYKKKTDGAMCEELGNDDHMNAYVMEAGKTSLCDVDTSRGCSDKEKKVHWNVQN